MTPPINRTVRNVILAGGALLLVIVALAATEKRWTSGDEWMVETGSLMEQSGSAAIPKSLRSVSSMLGGNIKAQNVVDRLEARYTRLERNQDSIDQFASEIINATPEIMRGCGPKQRNKLQLELRVLHADVQLYRKGVGLQQTYEQHPSGLIFQLKRILSPLSPP